LPQSRKLLHFDFGSLAILAALSRLFWADAHPVLDTVSSVCRASIPQPRVSIGVWLQQMEMKIVIKKDKIEIKTSARKARQLAPFLSRLRN